MSALFDRYPDQGVTRYKRYSETLYRYLRVSSRASALLARQVLEGWYAAYPVCARKQGLRIELRGDEDSFSAAYFELLLFTLLTRLGCSVTPEPQVIGASSKPDFLVELNSGEKFYMEAVVATGHNKDNEGERHTLARLYDYLNDNLATPQFFWSIRSDTVGHDTPSMRSLCKDIEQFARSLRWRDAARVGRRADLFETKIADRGWSFTIRAMPKHTRGFGKGRPVGMVEGVLGWSQVSESLRTRVSRKRDQHKHVDLPLVVAIFCDHDLTSRTDVLDALYGSRMLNIRTLDGQPVYHEWTRGRDGIWLDGAGAKKDDLAYVIVGRNLGLQDIVRGEIALYPNPAVDNPYSHAVPDLSRHVFQGDDIRFLNMHRTLASMLGMPDKWDGGDISGIKPSGFSELFVEDASGARERLDPRLS